MKFMIVTAALLALPVSQADNGAFEIVSPAEVECPSGKRCCPAPTLDSTISGNTYSFGGFEGEGYCEEGCSQDGLSVEVVGPVIANCPNDAVRCRNEDGSLLPGTTGFSGISTYENLLFGARVRCGESCDFQESKLFVGPATVACPNEGAVRCYASGGDVLPASGNSTHIVMSVDGFFSEARCGVECTVEAGNKVFVGPARVDCGGRGSACRTREGVVNITTDPETGNWYWLVEGYGEEARCYDDCVSVFNSTETIGPAEITCPMMDSVCMLPDGSTLNATSFNGDEALYALHKTTPETVRCDDRCSVRESMEIVGPAMVECAADGTFGCGSDFDDVPVGPMSMTVNAFTTRRCDKTCSVTAQSVEVEGPAEVVCAPDSMGCEAESGSITASISDAKSTYKLSLDQEARCDTTCTFVRHGEVNGPAKIFCPASTFQCEGDFTFGTTDNSGTTMNIECGDSIKCSEKCIVNDNKPVVDDDVPPGSAATTVVKGFAMFSMIVVMTIVL